MLTIKPFPWRRLTPTAHYEHCLDESGALLVRVVRAPDMPPFMDGVTTTTDRAGIATRIALPSLGFAALRAANGDGWMLHTRRAPRTMLHVATRWIDLVREASDGFALDERVLLATIGAGIGDVGPDAEHEIKESRTLVGYPARSGEGDAGDAGRDLLDWTASHGAHSAHGVMQTTIKQATSARADLFAKATPARYRDVLADPVVSLTCGAQVIAQMAADVRSDPIAQRILYLLGEAGTASHDNWGLKLDDELSLIRFIAAWNDDARLRAGERLDEGLTSTRPMAVDLPPSPTAPFPKWAWLLAGALTLGGGIACAIWWHERRKAAAERADDEDDSDEEPDDDSDEDDGGVLMPAEDAARLLAWREQADEEEDDELEDDQPVPPQPHGPFLLS
jgi:hypothetical protein